MSRYIKFLATLVFAVSVSSCDKGFFETAPQDKLSDLSFWKSEEDFTLAVNALYPYLEGAGNISKETMCDNAVRNQNWYADYEVSTGSGNDENSVFYGEWRHDYEGISRCNAVIKRLKDASEVSEAAKKQFDAQARFFRAYHYFKLAFLFKDVPLIKEPINKDDARNVSKTAQAEIYKFVFEELDAVEALLPASYSDDQRGRITKGAVQALKARYHLFVGNWQKAVDESQKIMTNTAMYELHNNYAEIFQYSGENSKEHILQHQYVRDAHECGTFGYAPIAIGGGSRISPLRSLYDAYLCTDGKSISESPLYDSNNQGANRDPRLTATIIQNGETFGGKVYNSLDDKNSPDYRGKGFDATRTGLNLKKHINLIDKDDSKKSHCDFSVIRLAEILLIYAEAKTELNQLDNSVYKAINDLRDRVGMPHIPTGLTQSQMRNTVRLERRVELAFEGQRFWDIKRWKIAEVVMNTKVYGVDVIDDANPADPAKPLYVAERKFNKNRDYLYPIPRKEFELNENLLPQNPGY